MHAAAVQWVLHQSAQIISPRRFLPYVQVIKPSIRPNHSLCQAFRNWIVVLGGAELRMPALEVGVRLEVRSRFAPRRVMVLTLEIVLQRLLRFVSADSLGQERLRLHLLTEMKLAGLLVRIGGPRDGVSAHARHQKLAGLPHRIGLGEHVQ